MITPAENSRIRLAAMQWAFEAEDWGAAIGRRAPDADVDRARDRKRKADRALNAALDDVTDWLATPEPVGKDG